MQKNIIVGVLVLVLMGGSFYGGMYYGKKQTPAFTQRGGGFQNLTPEERAQRMQDGAGRNGPRGGRGAMGGGLVNGDIIAKDDKSITIKLRDGGSRIVFVSATTDVTKPTKASLNDLTINARVFVTGDENADGSLTAKTVQLPYGAQ